MVVWVHSIVISRRTWPHTGNRTSQQMYRTNGNTHNILSLHRFGSSHRVALSSTRGSTFLRRSGKELLHTGDSGCTASGGIAARSREQTPGQRLKRNKVSSLSTTSYYQSLRPQPTRFFQTYGRVLAREILSRRGGHADTRTAETLHTGLPPVAAFLVSRAYRPF